MRRITAILSALILMVTPAAANIVAHYALAESLNSRQLYEECGKPDRRDFCLGFIMGTVSSIATSDLKVNFYPFCLPDEEPAQALVDIVLNYLKDDQQALGIPATLHIAMALEAAFPCPQPEASAGRPGEVYAFPVNSLNWLMSDPDEPFFLLDGVPDGFPLEEDGASDKGFFIERHGLGLRGFRTYSANVQVLLKDGTVRTIEGKIRAVGERTAPGRPIVPLMMVVGVDATIELKEAKTLVVDRLR